MEGGGCCKIQLIDEYREFNERGLKNFMSTTGFLNCSQAYSIVAVLGPQSSGKSTLMNHLFDTNFVEMDAYKGRTQTTKGIWIAKCTVMEPFTIAMDLEGTDSRERGEDDTLFEKQSTLFALAIADVVLINLWFHDIGRHHAACNPLLKVVFQVLMRIFNPPQKTLLFVIRDRSPQTPPDLVEDILWKDIHKIWDEIAKPEAHKNALLTNFFEVRYTFLPSFELEKEQFKQKVAELRQWISDRVGNKQNVIPASEFLLSTKRIWKTIEQNEDLKLPSHKSTKIYYQTVASVTITTGIVATAITLTLMMPHVAAVVGLAAGTLTAIASLPPLYSFVKKRIGNMYERYSENKYSKLN